MMELGHEMHLLTEQPIAQRGWRDYNSCALTYTGHLNGQMPDVSHLISSAQTLASHVDLFHVHNEPDFPVSVIKEATGKPVIYDIHDMVSQRTGSIDEWEQKALDACDAIVVPSGEYKQILQKRGILKPIVEILSGVPQKLYPQVRRKPQRLGIVYEGGLKGKPKKESQQFEWRSWVEVFYAISKMNIGVWCYPADSREDLSDYTNSGIIVMPSLPYDQMLKNLTAHEAGLVGSPFPDGAFDGALPNKLFEYIAAGLPVIAFNAPTAANFLEATGLGVGIKDLDELPEVLDRFHEEDRAGFVWSMRDKWSFETQSQKLETLYAKVTGTPVTEVFKRYITQAAD